MALKRLTFDGIMSSFTKVLKDLDTFIIEQSKDRDRAIDAECRAADARRTAEDNIAKANTARGNIEKLVG